MDDCPHSHRGRPTAVGAGETRCLAASLMILVFTLCTTLVLCGCTGQGTSSSSASSEALATPAYYVFEFITLDGYTITDPNQLVMDGDGGHFENWYYLSVGLLDGQSGKLCTFGRIVNFTYDVEGGVITLHAPTNEGIDFGFDGTKLEVGEGTLTLTDGEGVTVLRQVEEPPVPFK